MQKLRNEKSHKIWTIVKFSQWHTLPSSSCYHRHKVSSTTKFQCNHPYVVRYQE